MNLEFLSLLSLGTLANFDAFQEIIGLFTGLFQVAYALALLFVVVSVFMAFLGIPLIGKVISRMKGAGA